MVTWAAKTKPQTIYMKAQLLFIAMVCIIAWSSCSKTEIKPSNQTTSLTHVNFSSTRLATVPYASYAPSSPINLTGSHDITISGKSITGGTVPAITLKNCYNVHITQNSLGNSTSIGIYLINCKNITVDYNYITNVSTGVDVENTSGGGIIVNYNQFLNMKGPAPHGQLVMFNTVSGANNSISYNKGENIAGQSTPEDAINVYKSNGTASSPITIAGNWIRGGGPSTTGGGILLGNSGGSYQVASNNILVNPGQYGMAIGGGDHISITNNSIYAAAQSFTNVGIYVWGQGVPPCTNSTISGNKVKFINKNGTENDSWVAQGEATPTGWSTNTWGANIDASILPAVVVSQAAATMPIDNTTYVVSGVINLNGSHDITISGKSINGGSVPAITLTNCYNVHITKNMLGNSSNVGIYLYNCYNITIDYNCITKVSAGVLAVDITNGGIIVNNNQFKNMVGPMPHGQFVQFDNVSGANNSISYNRGENIFGQSNPEDAVNIYKSNGTASSPIQVVGNWIRGGGPSTSGGGIMLGDNGGSYQVASNNILVNPGEYGMAIAGGDNISITNNSTYAAAQSFTNIGVYVWGQSGSPCTNTTVNGNQVKFFNKSNIENDAWVATGEATPSGWSTNTFGANINASILPTVLISF
ncbi:MAG: right-handed parallel beta-helix repeat-containing protein [Mucilaginibacter sp.]|nr:right-handed parallel beta-helix repeat-containing protein [Mucilaginibacter sp.]